MKKTNALFSDLCFPFPEFQVGRVAFGGSNYYIFFYLTRVSVCLYFTANTSKLKTAVFYRITSKVFKIAKNAE